MIVLAIESSAIAASVALQKDDRLLAEMTLNRGNTHSENLLPMAQTLLKRLDLTTDDIDLFAVSAGPGSFTGVRIGVATVKGLAFGKGKPCVGVSTLQSLAENLSFLGDKLICPVMNARRNQVYTALFRGKERLLPDMAISIEELEAKLSAYPEPVLFVGDGYELVTSQIKHPYLPLPERLQLQSAASVAAVALRELQSGNATDDAHLSPVYLRPSQAERTRAENLKKQESN